MEKMVVNKTMEQNVVAKEAQEAIKVQISDLKSMVFFLEDSEAKYNSGLISMGELVEVYAKGLKDLSEVVLQKSVVGLLAQYVGYSAEIELLKKME